MTFHHITHHVAVGDVTGSCHQLHPDAASSYMVDCGLYQGAEAWSSGKAGQNCLEIEFPLETLRAFIATCDHTNYVGRVPLLLAPGFRGPIVCSEFSAKLLPIVLEGTFKLCACRDQKQVKRYIKLIEQHIIALPRNSWFTLQALPGPALPHSPSACLPYSRFGLCRNRPDLSRHGINKRMVFFGDLGAPHTPLLLSPEPSERVDILVLEIIYGGHLQGDRHTRRQRLEAVTSRPMADHGTVLIPAFSIGRTKSCSTSLKT